MAGVFVTVEGIDGAGKSTQAARLADRLERAGQRVCLTREPGGSAGAEAIRALLLGGDPGHWSAETEALLFNAARRDHVERRIRPALDAGHWVVCDRYVDSTRAYQGSAALRTLVDRLHELAIGLDPDLTLIFDLDPADGLVQRTARADAPDRFESRGSAFQTRLRDAYLGIAAAEPGRCRLIDAAGSEDAVAARVWDAIAPRLAVS